ncbi:MAG: adenylate/guanylate cyclase domain-containing protein [Deltaproteobacteria bacterium]|nr:adenylate/guanylate cyclase domain-containing protein [Deltaproteobacteria bacterium]MBW2695296.1 adenylate/guanylate cyclase domain-containing protein [Deltaproteobacteria bacterium]
MSGWSGVLASRPALFITGALAAFSVVVVVRSAGLLEPAELWLYDEQIRRVARAPTPAPALALVVIDEEDVRRFGHPLPDRALTRVLRRILEAGPLAVGVDLYRDLPVPRESHGSGWTRDYRALGDLVIGDPRIVMTMKVPDPDGEGTPRPGFLSDDSQVGFSDLPVDPGGTVRRYLLDMWTEEGAYSSMALRLAILALGAEGISPVPSPEDPELPMLGPTVIRPFQGDDGPYVHADDAGFQLLLDYRWGTREIPTYRISDVADGRVGSSELRGRTVILGTTAVSIMDAFQTPLEPESAAGMLPGMRIHAHAVDQLVRYAHGQGAPLQSPSRLLQLLWLLLFSFAGAGLGVWNRRLALQAIGLALLFSAVVIAGRVAFSSGLWLGVVPPLLASGFGAMGVAAVLAVRERAQRRAIAGLFSRFQGTAVADEIWRRRDEFLEDGRPVSRRVRLTALMSDLEGYTAASEKMEPQVLMVWVNEYMDAMAQLVESHAGVVDDYAGDGIKANFGFPVASEGAAAIDADARAAVRCALAMGARMEALNQSWSERGLSTGRCRVGVFTGPAVVGCIGATRSLKFTSVGDTVNTAARLEGFAKDDFSGEEGGVAWRILIGEETYRRIGNGFEVRSIGTHRLKGKDVALPIYRVLGVAPEG